MAARRIILATTGSYGDIYPFLALGRALAARGLAPVIATSEDYRAMVEEEGLAFHAVRPRLADLAARIPGGDAELLRRIKRRGVGFLLNDLFAPAFAETLADQEAIVPGAAAMVSSTFSFAARIAAERAGLPTVSVMLSPMLLLSAERPFRAREAPFLPVVRRLFGRRATAALLRYMISTARLAQGRVRRFRRSVGLPPGREVLLEEALHADLVACLWSPLLAPQPTDAGANVALLGFGWHDAAADGLPEPVARFLDAGEAPLVFSLGSFLSADAADFYRDSVAAARTIGRRALLLVAPGEEAAVAAGWGAGADIHVAGYVPHALVFPRAAAVIHHGGVGTMAQALRAGAPQLVCPIMGDQHDNATLALALGVAAMLDVRAYDARRAAAALSRLLGGRAAERARALAPAVAREDGAAALSGRIMSLVGG